ncbi:Bax inhibitor-1/YccA family protein [Galactobacter caseinivorans]|uniref:Bax inhibitor-1/YccA family protein n=1 Tax=Galactobacter caseinivorans TaxID=2676123 RepID=A0A496PJD0_9MICC|nr:Bax inhibitor-1/YccA family protein [Galactobacter caseinivorans]RKW70604.1 hypothetical protein DWQ67_05630 [Galactobacter caseinivorans]
MAKGSNPVFKSASFQDQLRRGNAANAFPTPSPESLDQMYSQPPKPPQTGDRMGVNDVLNKMLIMIAGLLVGGFVGWQLLAVVARNAALNGGSMTTVWLVVGAAGIAALVIALVNQMRREVSPTLSVIYAVVEGFLLGAISAMFELIYPGIVIQAVLGTSIIFALCLFLFRSGKFRTTPKMRRVVFAAAWGIVIFSLVNMLISMVSGGAFNFRTGWIGLVIGVISIAIGAFFLVTDFEDIQTAMQAGAPKSFAWRCAFGLTLSLVWIYVEMIRVIAIIRSMVSN